MKKNKDWTRVLQERLQDAQLPLEDGWASSSFADLTGESPKVGPKTPGIPGRPAKKTEDGPDSVRFPGRWWPWALAGAAAVIIAAFLLLHPAPEPEQNRLVQVTTQHPAESSANPSEIDPEPSAPADGVFQTGGPELFFGSRKTNSGSANPSADPIAPSFGDSASSFAGLTGEPPSSNPALNEDEGLKTEDSSSNQAASEDGTPQTTAPSSKQADSEDEVPFLDDPRTTRRANKGKIALRLSAATARNALLGGNNQPQSSHDVFDDVGNVSIPPARKTPVMPVSVGVSLSIPLDRTWVLSAGLDYMQRDGYRQDGNNLQSLTLHYLGVPVDLQYYFNPESRWRFYLGAGLHAAKCIYATGGQALPDPVLFSGSVMAGTDIRLFPGVRLYLAPVLSVPFNRSAYINSWDDKLQFQVRAGLSFDL